MINDFMGFEADGSILEHRFAHDGMLIWPFARFSLFSRAMEMQLGLQPAHAQSEGLAISEKLSYLIRSILRNPLRIRRTFDAVMFGTTAGVSVQRDGKWLGRINDYYALEYPDSTLVVDFAYRCRYKSPRIVPYSACFDWLNIQPTLRARLAGGVSSVDRKAIQGFLDHVRDRFPLKLDREYLQGLQGRLESWAARLPYFHANYSALFRRLRPRIVFVEDGSYGYHSHILKWAKDMGIATAEFQHGLIVPSDAVYNYGFRGSAEDAYKPYLPDYLLMYGGFSAANARTPSRKIVIGNPHFDHKREEYGDRPRAASDPKQVLIVSQGTVSRELVEVTLKLARILPKRYRIIYRLHPGEVPFKERFEALGPCPNVTVQSSGDIYDLIYASDWVVGSSSLTLFEAAGFGRPVFVLEGNNSLHYVPKHFGTWFKDAGELLDLIQGSSKAAPMDVAHIWAENWKTNYRDFLAGIPERATAPAGDGRKRIGA